MPSPRVQKSAAKLARLGPAVFAAGALRADREQQAITERDHEVIGRHTDLTLWVDLQEPCGPRPTKAPNVHSILVRQLLQQLLSSHLTDLLGPNTLELGSRLTQI